MSAVALLSVFCAATLLGADAAVLSPPRGWSTWNLFNLLINETCIVSQAEAIVDAGLLAAGYEYVLIDDGWTECLNYSSDGSETCLIVPDRNAATNWTIPVNKRKFPNGMKVVVDVIHRLGMKAGIYTAVSARTCGGYIGSLDFETVDAAWFVEQGFDFVKSDTCNTDCPVHNGCLQNSTQLLSDGLRMSSKDIVYYIDSGNPTSPQGVYNPHQYHVRNEQYLLKLAVVPGELVWRWAHGVATMWKSWFDSYDKWRSTLGNVHNQIRIAEYQSCGSWNHADFLTIGLGGQPFNQYRAQFLLWIILGSPLILSADVTQLSLQEMQLLTNANLLAVAADSDCTAGSLVSGFGSGEVWIRPLHDKTFAVVLLNKGPVAENVTLYISESYDGYGDFFPSHVDAVIVEDLLTGALLGTFSDVFSASIGPRDASIYRMTPRND